MGWPLQLPCAALVAVHRQEPCGDSEFLVTVHFLSTASQVRKSVVVVTRRIVHWWIQPLIRSSVALYVACCDCLACLHKHSRLRTMQRLSMVHSPLSRGHLKLSLTNREGTAALKTPLQLVKTAICTPRMLRWPFRCHLRWRKCVDGRKSPVATGQGLQCLFDSEE